MDNSEQVKEEKELQEPEKQSTKTFSQSENDKLVKQALEKQAEKYGDYSSVKSELEALKNEKAERERAEMSEVEKRDSIIEELKKERLEKDKQLFEFTKTKAIDNILSDAKYNKMPKAYKNMVKYSESNEEMLASADNALNEFETDFGGQVKDTFGIPNTQTPVNPSKAVKGQMKNGDFRSALKAQIADKLKNRG